MTRTQKTHVGIATMFALGLWGGPDAAGRPATPVPERPAHPIPPVSWSTFEMSAEDTLNELPVRSSILRGRWRGLARALGAVDSVTTVPPPAPPAAVPSEEVAVAPLPLPGESPAFQAAFAEALARAREDDPAGCRTALAAASPRTLEGETAAARLRFAAAVSGEDLEEAQTLFYRLTWTDGGRTTARMEAWRALADGNGDRVESALGTLVDPTPGERAALAVGRWQRGFQSGGSPGEDWMEVEGLARVALALAAGAQASASGDAEGASRPILGLRGAEVPPAWRPAYDALSETGGGASDPSRDDVAAYREAASLFLEGRDEAASSRLGVFLAQWPGSTHRPLAYLLRAHLHTAAGRSTEAESDLRAVDTLPASAEVVGRARMLRAFLAAQAGGARDAVSTVDAVLAADELDRFEGEVRFDRIRLLRLGGDAAGAEAAIRELEEAYPDQPWAARARADGTASHWREPWRTLPVEPEPRREIPAPTEGPWGRLLWGDFVLSREAETWSATTPQDEAAIPSEVPPEPEVGDAQLVYGNVPTGRLAYLEAGIGGPVFGSLGGGVGGAMGGFLYRVEASQFFAQERNGLPEYRRTDWEIAGANLDAGIRVGGALEGTGHTDDDAPGLGLNPDPIDAYSWVGRVDVGSGNLEHTGVAASVSRLWGDLDAGSSGTWRTTQTWFEGRGSLEAGAGRWEGRWRSADFHYDAEGPTEDHWWHDLRFVLVRPSGFYLGGRAGIYRDRGLVLPVAGIRSRLGGWETWLRAEPGLDLPGFRETFVANADWNVPDFGLPAERKTLDLEAGISRRNLQGEGLTAQAMIYDIDELRTWRRQGPLWVEHSVDDADGLELSLSGETELGSFRLQAEGHARSLRAEDRRVPYVPSLEGWVALFYETNLWRAGTRFFGVEGREDEVEAEYGSYLRWDLEGALQFHSPVLFLSDRMEIALRIENLTDVEDRRWPGIPGYGRGVFLGVRSLFGTPAGM